MPVDTVTEILTKVRKLEDEVKTLKERKEPAEEEEEEEEEDYFTRYMRVMGKKGDDIWKDPPGGSTSSTGN